MYQALFDLGAASTPIQPIPAQEILRLLQTHPWFERKLRTEERALLIEAAKFLKSVKKGQAIIRKSVKDGTFMPDVVSLDAYEYTRRALENSYPSRYRTFKDFEMFVNQVYEALNRILRVDDREEGKEHLELAEEPRIFFETFTNYSYGRILGIPHP